MQTTPYKVDEHIEYQAAKIVNEYINFWQNGSEFSKYKLEYLDSKYYFLINSYIHKKIDIFNYTDSIYYKMFMVT
jgi:hypothetical protein